MERRSLLLLFLLLIFCVAASIQINEKAKKNRLNLKTGSTEEFRKLGMEEAFFQVLAKTDHEKRGRLYAIYFLENSLFPQDNEKELFEKWSEKEEWKSFEKICTALWNDIRYFPVPESPKHPQYQVSFVDSWMGERTYGGKRGHEGCDLMASKDIPGLYPVVSMTDGVVSARGWLEKGGYRIGITAPSGAYFYYAHLDSYGSYQEGDEVKEMVKEYQRRRDYAVKAINDIDGIHCLCPKGAFYIFINAKKLGKSSAELAQYLLDEAKIALVPGDVFGKNGEGYLRMSFANSYESVVAGCEGLKRMAAKLMNK